MISHVNTCEIILTIKFSAGCTSSPVWLNKMLNCYMWMHTRLDSMDKLLYLQMIFTNTCRYDERRLLSNSQRSRYELVRLYSLHLSEAWICKHNVYFYNMWMLQICKEESATSTYKRLRCIVGVCSVLGILATQCLSQQPVQVLHWLGGLTVSHITKVMAGILLVMCLWTPYY